MKTTIKKYLLVALMFGTLITNANDNEVLNTTSDIKKVKIAFETVKKGHVLTIKNEDGTVLYSKEIEKNGTYSRTFDLSKLEKGNYTTELNKDYEIIIKSFSVNDGTVKFNDVKKVFKPVIRTENNLVLVSKMGFDKEPLQISLFYKDEIIYSETIKDDKKPVLNRVFKVSKEEKGDYKVIINTNERSFTKKFNI